MTKPIERKFVDVILVKAWLWSTLFWLLFFSVLGLLVALKFNYPNFLGGLPWLTFGRLRPAHVNGMVFGVFSAAVIGFMHYYVPMLCARPMVAAAMAWWAFYGWNAAVALATLALLAGFNSGIAFDEYVWPFRLLLWLALAVTTLQVCVTVMRRHEPRLYISLCYTIVALVWTLLNLLLGGLVLPYFGLPGVMGAALEGFYAHGIFTLWVAPLGLATLYYFLPLSVDNALFSRKLALLGFWLQAAAFPFIGIAEYLYSPIPYVQQTLAIIAGVLLALSIVMVAANTYDTAAGRWLKFSGGQDGASFGAKFIMMGMAFLLLGAILGVVGSLRSVQASTHFTDYPVAHAYSMFYAGFTSILMGGMYYVWPRVTGRELWSPYIASWHLWLTMTGGALIIAALANQGFIQGDMLRYRASFIDTLVEMGPWWMTRTLSGVVIGIGFVLMATNFYRTQHRGAEVEFVEKTREKADAAEPPTRLSNWRAARVFGLILIPGMGFLGMALVVQAGAPSLDPAVVSAAVQDTSTGMLIRATDYTPLERRGRDVYVREGCVYCHSQQVRPIAFEDRRWGPVAQGGEYFYDHPPLLGTRRVGPDLLRVGRKYSDDWHTAHYWDPRVLYPSSNMPAYTWLFGGSEKGHAAPRLNEDGQALNAYLQRLGTHIGDWLEDFPSTNMRMGAALQARSGPNDAHERDEGRGVYRRLCQGCHGADGRGDGPAAKFLAIPPTDLTRGIFKFRSTMGINSLPSDQDLYATINNGLAGTAMSPWYELDTQERMAVVQYIKTFSGRWKGVMVTTSLDLPPEPAVTRDGLAHGKTLYTGSCAKCHGEDGRGAALAAPLSDQWGRRLRVPDLTLPMGEVHGVKRGHHSHEYFTVIMTGVGGTPMTPFAGKLSVDEIWDVVHYAQSLRIDAHMQELRQAGLRPSDEATARNTLWTNLSRTGTDTMEISAKAPVSVRTQFIADRQ